MEIAHYAYCLANLSAVERNLGVAMPKLSVLLLLMVMLDQATNVSTEVVAGLRLEVSPIAVCAMLLLMWPLSPIFRESISLIRAGLALILEDLEQTKIEPIFRSCNPFEFLSTFSLKRVILVVDYVFVVAFEKSCVGVALPRLILPAASIMRRSRLVVYDLCLFHVVSPIAFSDSLRL